jgi:hypothetical protein
MCVCVCVRVRACARARVCVLTGGVVQFLLDAESNVVDGDDEQVFAQMYVLIMRRDTEKPGGIDGWKIRSVELGAKKPVW